jgi:hypothetical protein
MGDRDVIAAVVIIAVMIIALMIFCAPKCSGWLSSRPRFDRGDIYMHSSGGSETDDQQGRWRSSSSLSRSSRRLRDAEVMAGVGDFVGYGDVGAGNVVMPRAPDNVYLQQEAMDGAMVENVVDAGGDWVVAGG